MLMSDGRGYDEWARASLIATMIVNVNIDTRKNRQLKPNDFNPYEIKNSTCDSPTKESMSRLKDIFENTKRRK